MSLMLYYHPLLSFCRKALIALYENAIPFTPHLVDLSDATHRAQFLALCCAMRRAAEPMPRAAS